MNPAAPQQQSLLLALPEPLLLAVLQCLAAAGDHCSMFSAARAHSSLHQAAVALLNSVSVQGIKQQQVLDSVLTYLGKHGQHIRSLGLAGAVGMDDHIRLRHLPANLQPHSLELINLKVQLMPGKGWQGVLGHAAGVSALTQLRLERCMLLDGDNGMAAAMVQLSTRLEHLSIECVSVDDADACKAKRFRSRFATIATGVLQQRLQQLTHLQLANVMLESPEPSIPVLQPLQALSQLVDLRLAPMCAGHRLGTIMYAVLSASTWPQDRTALTASMLSGATGLTRLEVKYFEFHPGTLAGKTRLQHLTVQPPRDAAGTAQLLAQLANLQQLTCLKCPDLRHPASPAAYSAMTASSNLQHLDITNSTLPEGVWQHMFPAGRHLPQLTSLEAAYVKHPDGHYLAAPKGSRLVSCCPGLQRLNVQDMVYSAGAFAFFQGLSGLRSLTVLLTDAMDEATQAVCQLAGLRDLTVYTPFGEDTGELLLQLTGLQQLTRLSYDGRLDGRYANSPWVAQAPGDEPVLRQVLQLHLKHSNPAVAQAAAAALAGAE